MTIPHPTPGGTGTGFPSRELKPLGAGALPKRLLAVDPGPDYYAWVMLIDGKVGDMDVDALPLGELDVDQIVCEWITIGGLSSASIYDTCRMVGRLEERAAACHIPFALYPRIQVKLDLLGMARVKDADVRNEVIRRLGPRGTKKNPGPTYGVSGHLWQALALGLAWLEKGRVQSSIP